eukprot:117482-Chlamydomonas_euryale.AAC.4
MVGGCRCGRPARDGVWGTTRGGASNNFQFQPVPAPVRDPTNVDYKVHSCLSPCTRTNASSRVQHRPKQQPESQIVRGKGPRDLPQSRGGMQLAIKAPRAPRLEVETAAAVATYFWGLAPGQGQHRSEKVAFRRAATCGAPHVPSRTGWPQLQNFTNVPITEMYANAPCTMPALLSMAAMQCSFSVTDVTLLLWW